MNDRAKPADKTKDDEKQLKKLLDSYLEVAKHKLGRPATMEDLQKMLSENPGQEEMPGAKTPSPIASVEPGKKVIDGATDSQAPQQVSSDATLEKAEPKILHMKLYYGMSGDGEAKKADPSRVLFYESPDGRWFDTSAQEWTDKRPSVADHLPNRPIQFNEKDIVAAIANGVMDGDDFEALDKAQMIEETPRKLWNLTQKLHNLKDDLAKSEETEADEYEEIDEDFTAEAPKSGVDVVANYMDTAGVEWSGEELSESEVGEDVIAQIMEAAVAAVSDEMSNQVRKIIQEELARYGFGEQLESESDTDDLVSTEPDEAMTEV